MQPIGTLSHDESVSRITFLHTIQEIAHQYTTNFIEKIYNGGFSSANLLSKRDLRQINPDFHPFIKKIHVLVKSQLELIDQSNAIKPFLKDSRILIPSDQIQELIAAADHLILEHSNSWTELLKSNRSTRKILDFVEDFNNEYQELPKLREEALEIIKCVKQETWEFENRIPTVPIAETLPAARCGLFHLSCCNDPLIKEYAIIALIELLEWDPLQMTSAYRLMELQRHLLEEIRACKAQDLNTNLQRILIKAYAVSTECILLHYGSGHLNGISNEMKQELWNGAEELKGLNVSNDPEIRFWAKYAIQGIQHIQSDNSALENILERVGKIASAGISIAAAFNNLDGAPAALAQAFLDLQGAFTHIEWHANWFEELLLLKKLSRFSIMNPSAFRNVSRIFKNKRNINASKTLLYGIITILEYVILNSPSGEIRVETIKILLQYYSLAHEETKIRVLKAIEKMYQSEDLYLKHTGYVINHLLIAGGRLSSDRRIPPLDVEREFIYENVLKFLLLRLAEIKGSFDLGGHSLVTLLCTSEVEQIIPPLLKCITELCPSFQEPDIWGNTLFHFMVKQGYTETLQHIQSEMDIDINAQEFVHGYSALHNAARMRSSRAVELLLELGADPDLLDKEGNTPLHHAIICCKKITETLLKNGANPNILNHKGQTPLNLAIEEGKVSRIQLLREFEGVIAENAQGITPLMFAAKVGNVPCIKMLASLQSEAISEPEAFELVRYGNSLDTSSSAHKSFWNFLKALLKKNHLYASAFSSQKLFNIESIKFDDSNLMRFAKSAKNLKKLKKRLQKGANPNLASRFGQTPLHTAAAFRNHQAVRLLLKFHAEPKQKDVNGFTPVHLAAYQGDLKSLRSLLNFGGDPDLKNDFGETPFLVGCGVLPYRRPPYVNHDEIKNANSVKVLQVLLDAGADVEASDPLGNNAMHRAMISGTENVIHWLYEHFPELMWQKNEQGMLPIECAIHSGRYLNPCVLMNEDLLELHHTLIEQTDNTLSLGNLLVLANMPEVFQALIDIDVEFAYHKDASQMQYSPLHIAAMTGNLDILTIYFQNALDIELLDAAGNTPAHLAAYYQKGDFLRHLKQNRANLLIKNRDGRTPLHLAATKNNIDGIEAQLSDEGLSEVDNQGNTALHLACRYGRENILEALWTPLLQVNDEGNTPLHEACLHGQNQAVRFLIQKNAPMEACNTYGQTPLMLAAQEGHSQTVIQLLIVGANIWAVDDEGDNALLKAVFNQHYDAIEALLQREKTLIPPLDGTLVERTNHDGNNVLNSLARKAPIGNRENSENILIQLLEAGADPYLKNQKGESFLHQIAYYGRLGLYEGLKEVLRKGNKRLKLKKLGLNMKDLKRQTPLHKAVLGNHPDLIDRLCLDGAKADKKDQEGLTPLLLAIKMGFWKSARTLLTHRANPKEQSNSGMTIFHYLFDREKIDDEAAEFLVDCIHTFPKIMLKTDSRQRTPLHIIAEKGHYLNLFVLRFLPEKLEKKTEFVWAKAEDGFTAHEIAVQYDHDKLARQIRTFPPEFLGADYKMRSKPLLSQE